MAASAWICLHASPELIPRPRLQYVHSTWACNLLRNQLLVSCSQAITCCRLLGCACFDWITDLPWITRRPSSFPEELLPASTILFFVHFNPIWFAWYVRSVDGAFHPVSFLMTASSSWQQLIWPQLSRCVSLLWSAHRKCASRRYVIAT